MSVYEFPGRDESVEMVITDTELKKDADAWELVGALSLSRAAAAAGSLLFGQVQVVDGRQVAGAAAALCTAALGAQAADHVVCLAADKERLAAASALFLRFT